MMQSCASLARLLGGGPILSLGTKAMVGLRVTAASDRPGIAVRLGRPMPNPC
jgi:hypothetical protein